MSRTLGEIKYSDGNIASGTCTGCGQVFATSPIPLVIGGDEEWRLVAAFGSRECTPAEKVVL
jgi:hypothetical protein